MNQPKQTNYQTNYDQFVKGSLERLSVHLGEYGDGTSYLHRQSRENSKYIK